MKLLVPRSLALVALACAAPLASQEDRSPFKAPTLVLQEPDQAPFRLMIDFENDGDLDAVGLRSSINGSRIWVEVVAYVNEGGHFSEVWTDEQRTDWETLPESQPLIVPLHLNGDDLMDFFVMYRDERFDYTSLGDTGFLAAPDEYLPDNARAAAAADLDGDGLGEHVWSASALAEDADRTLWVRWSTGRLDPLLHDVPLVKYVRVLPDDGPAEGEDLILLSGADRVQVFSTRDSGAPNPGATFFHGFGETLFDVGDIDGDGDLDAVVFSPDGGGTYRVLRRTDAGTWGLEAPQVGGPAEFLRDVDGDGDLDGVCCSGGPGDPVFQTYDQPSEFLISLNDGAGNFAPAFALRGLGSPQLAGVVDVDGDGDKDLVAGRCIYYADGPIGPEDGVGAMGEAPPVEGPRDLVDVDGDGDPDACLTLRSVWVNDGTGRFQRVRTQVERAPAGTIYRGPGFPGDFDGDGDVDLLVEWWPDRFRIQRGLPAAAQGSPIAMVLLENDGSGSFSFARIAGPLGSSMTIDSLTAEASIVIDGDKDGDLDLLTRSVGAGGASRLWNNDGAGRFTLAGSLDARIEWVGYVDPGEVFDLVASRESEGIRTFHAFIGFEQTPGSFPVMFEANYGPASELLSAPLPMDLNGDGRMDFTFLSRDEAQVGETDDVHLLVLENVLPDSSLLEETWPLSGGQMGPGSRLALGDLDGDLVPDGLFGRLADALVPTSVVRWNFGADRPGSDVLQLMQPGWLVDLDLDGDLDVLGDEIVLHR